MIVAGLRGGLGNQIFVYALGRSLAHKLNTELKLDLSSYKFDKVPLAVYRLGDLNIQENFATEDELKNLQVVNEKNYDFDSEVLNCPNDVYLNGHWMSGKYFEDIEDILREELTLKNPLHKRSAAWEKKILSAECAVAVHLRFGDYTTPHSIYFRGIPSTKYYSECIEELKKTFPNITLFVFSDDLEFAKKVLPKNLDVPVEFVSRCEKPLEEIYLMSICKHNIISNGTFAWWGAWLNKNPDKKVFAPHPWHRGTSWLGKDVVPEDWIKIPAHYERNSNFPPFLSIIYCVENNSAETAFNLATTFSQNFLDYEVIIADTTNDDGEKISRRFAGNDKVTFLNLDDKFDKISAWNKGLEYARGEYVLFLSDKDFIFQQTTMQLCMAWHSHFQTHYIDKGIYIDSRNYNNIGSSIVCATQSLVEDAEGSNTIQGFDDKKFALKIDAPFQNLNSIIEPEFDDAQKLGLLASGQIDSRVGTKFFKRNFLEKNSLRFHRTAGGKSSELLFLINAFLLSKDIVFVPNVFTGKIK